MGGHSSKQSAVFHNVTHSGHSMWGIIGGATDKSTTRLNLLFMIYDETVATLQSIVTPFHGVVDGG